MTSDTELIGGSLVRKFSSCYIVGLYDMAGKANFTLVKERKVCPINSLSYLQRGPFKYRCDYHYNSVPEWRYYDIAFYNTIAFENYAVNIINFVSISLRNFFIYLCYQAILFRKCKDILKSQRFAAEFDRKDNSVVFLFKLIYRIIYYPGKVFACLFLHVGCFIFVSINAATIFSIWSKNEERVKQIILIDSATEILLLISQIILFATGNQNAFSYVCLIFSFFLYYNELYNYVRYRLYGIPAVILINFIKPSEGKSAYESIGEPINEDGILKNPLFYQNWIIKLK